MRTVPSTVIEPTPPTPEATEAPSPPSVLGTPTDAPPPQPLMRVAQRPPRRRIPLYAWLVGAWSIGLLPLLSWGLPSDSIQDLIYWGGSWESEALQADVDLARRQARAAGADVDLNPLASRTGLVLLTPNLEARSEILRRYRLYTRQPDEMITLMALQRMQPPRSLGALWRGEFDLDPRLYQYGGAYVYLVGAVLAAAGSVGLLTLTREIGFYLDNPAAFGQFYVAARVLSLAGGAFLLLAVGRLVKQAAGPTAAWLAVGLAGCTPVVIAGSLEAKPHMLSTALLLWALYAALEFRRHGRWRDALLLGLTAGLAWGFVLTGLLGLLLWPALAATGGLRAAPAGRRRRPGLDAARLVRWSTGLGVALLVYAVTNPYVLYNAVWAPERLGGNLENSLAMYAGQWRHLGAGALQTGMLLVLGAGGWWAGVALLGLVLTWRAAQRHRPSAGLVAVLPLAFVLLGILLLAGKPLEAARFLALPITLLAAAGAWLCTLAPERWRGLYAVPLLLGVLLTSGWPAWRAYWVDAYSPAEPRQAAARHLLRELEPGERVGLITEPAPYSAPPLDYRVRPVVLLPPHEPADLRLDDLPEWLSVCLDWPLQWPRFWWARYYQQHAVFPEFSAGGQIGWASKLTIVGKRIKIEPP